jgi:hypothetical protein
VKKEREKNPYVYGRFRQESIEKSRWPDLLG